MDRQIIRTLLVEDNPGDVRLVREMRTEAGGNLSGLAFDSAHSERLGQAMELLENEPFDVSFDPAHKVRETLDIGDQHEKDTHC
jgi:hypothetical protein